MLRYVIVGVVNGKAGDFNNNLRLEVFKKFGAKSSKLQAHFTIKAPFEYEGSIAPLEAALEKFCRENSKAPYRIDGYGHFNDRVIYMKVDMSNEGKELHGRLIESMSPLPFIQFDKKDGKNKVFHVTVASKGINRIYNELWDYINAKSCSFECEFDNVSIFKWQNYTWVLHKEYRLE